MLEKKNDSIKFWLCVVAVSFIFASLFACLLACLLMLIGGRTKSAATAVQHVS